MTTQQNHKFTAQDPVPVIEKEAWLDVSEIACGVGFTTAVKIGIALNDTLQPLRNEVDDDYDQRLYDVLWQAYLRLSLERHRSVSFHFILARKGGSIENISEVSVRVRAEAQKQMVLVGSPGDF